VKARRATPGFGAALLSYATSGDATGARGDSAIVSQGSVSYASIAFGTGLGTKGGGTVEPLDLFPQDRVLGAETKKKLLALARTTIARYLGGERHEALSAYVDWTTLPAETKFKAGAFVTLEKKGELRGCIGTILPEDALWEAIVGNAINAAVNDYRFGAVRKEELAALSLEISVLTTPREVKGPEEFLVGKHGILIEKNGRRAVFLPQVAPEQGWNREQTLDHLAAKAGLEAGAWRTGTRFWVFEAQVFGEDA
jgi:MEMO1 family protein